MRTNEGGAHPFNLSDQLDIAGRETNVLLAGERLWISNALRI
jgi:hypothetical protein